MTEISEPYFHSHKGMLYFGVNNSPWLSPKDGDDISLEDIFSRFEFKNVRIDIIDLDAERDQKISNKKTLYGSPS